MSSNKTPKGKFKCTYEGCNVTYLKNSRLIWHIRKHTGERPFKCDIEGCDKTYTNNAHLRRHKKTSHDSSESEIETLPCPKEGCFKEFANKYSLRKHMLRAHNPDRDYPFKCNECKQGFHKKRQLQKHSYLHSGEKPFKCYVCDLGFITHADCNRHKRTHTEYICDCGKHCERWVELMEHQKNEHKLDFVCDICNKTFANKSNLRSHKNVHTPADDKEIFVCPYDDCNRYYIYKRNLKQHIHFKHEKKPKKKIPCPIDGCEAQLSRMSVLKKHLDVHKNGPKKSSNRAPRKDKHIPKKSVASILVGIKHGKEKEFLKKEVVNKEYDISDELTEEEETDTPSNASEIEDLIKATYEEDFKDVEYSNEETDNEIENKVQNKNVKEEKDNPDEIEGNTGKGDEKTFIKKIEAQNTVQKQQEKEKQLGESGSKIHKESKESLKEKADKGYIFENKIEEVKKNAFKIVKEKDKKSESPPKITVIENILISNGIIKSELSNLGIDSNHNEENESLVNEEVIDGSDDRSKSNFIKLEILNHNVEGDSNTVVLEYEKDIDLKQLNSYQIVRA